MKADCWHSSPISQPTIPFLGTLAGTNALMYSTGSGPYYHDNWTDGASLLHHIIKSHILTTTITRKPQVSEHQEQLLIPLQSRADMTIKSNLRVWRWRKSSYWGKPSNLMHTRMKWHWIQAWRLFDNQWYFRSSMRNLGSVGFLSVTIEAAYYSRS